MSRTQVKVEVLSQGLSELMYDPAIIEMVNASGSQIQQFAGPLFEFKPAEGHGDRPIALVVPADYEGKVAEARDKVLSKAVVACAL